MILDLTTEKLSMRTLIFQGLGTMYLLNALSLALPTRINPPRAGL